MKRRGKQSRRVTDVAAWILAQTRLAAPVNPWVFARKVGMRFKPTVDGPDAVLCERDECIQYNLRMPLDEARRVVLRETCRALLRMWDRDQSNVTCGALAFLLTASEPSPLRLVYACAHPRPGLRRARASRSSFRRVALAPAPPPYFPEPLPPLPA